MKVVPFRAKEEDIVRWKTAAAEARVSFSEFTRRALDAAEGSTPAVTAAGGREVAPPTSEPPAVPPSPSKPKPARKGKCEHRLPKGSFCKACGKTKE